ncbi:haloacid dehalogenase type II [Rubrivivax gelatinosus]|uniref:(S)-2-haloacid dehalogenase n=1 Tax=Rubrivivax gelatinosus TaxID=28068 RepID=A0A4R2M7C7_RUBGE|nr:haloacid dehalogenase type II [Rubrivivax gelatinosus]MBK1689487.1 haloacid dehalogenase type II [Rubrivivax gelatinosus]TCP00815.1 2-haloacid dehalogenase [Rubrivivax gelatinosus]
MVARPPVPPRAVVFDAYGTLFDVYSVGLLAEQLFPGHGEALARLWRDKQIDYTRLVSMSGRYRPFWDLTRAGLRYAAQRLGLALDAAAEDRLMNQYRHLSAFPENREVLEALKARAIPAAILSNGDPEMLAVAVRSAGFAPLLQHVISVEPVQRYKTDPAAYALAPAALGLAAREILFVSSNGWDALGATWYGFTTLWVNRAGLPPEPLATPPTRTGTSLRDVLSFFPS